MSGQPIKERSIADLYNQGMFAQLGLGSVFFADGVKPAHFLPSWKGDNPLVFVPVGEFDSEGKMREPFDFTTGDPMPTNWYFRLPVVSYMGSRRKVEFPLFDPFAMLDGTYDVATNPYVWLRSTITHMSKQEKYKHWKPLLEREGEKEGAMLPKYTERYFFQGAVFQEGRGYVGDARGRPRGLQTGDKHLAVVSMGRNAGEQVVNLVLEFSREREGHAAVNLLDGQQPRYIVFANPDKHHPTTYDPTMVGQIQKDIATAAAESNMDDFTQAVGSIDQSASDDGGFTSYTVAAVPRVIVKVGKTTKVLPPFPWGRSQAWSDSVRARYRPISSLFKIPSHEEQIRLICSALEDRPEILAAAFPPNSQYFTADVARTISNRQSISAGSLGLSDEARADPMAFLSGVALKGKAAHDLAMAQTAPSQGADDGWSLDQLFDGVAPDNPYSKAQNAFGA